MNTFLNLALNIPQMLINIVSKKFLTGSTLVLIFVFIIINLHKNTK